MSLNFTYLPRTIETVINRASQRYKGVMVTGMRQVGKSTMLRRMQGDRRYVNLDRYQALDLARQAPDAFFKQYPMPLLVDEFQRELPTSVWKSKPFSMKRTKEAWCG